MNDHLSRKELFIRFTASAFRKLLSIYEFNCFPFGFEGRMWDLIVSVPDHCLSFYFIQLPGAIKSTSRLRQFSILNLNIYVCYKLCGMDVTSRAPYKINTSIYII